MGHLRANVVLLGGTFVACAIAYPLAVLGLAQAVLPLSANGSLVDRDGRVVGSVLIAQNFTSAKYFHGRPSACDYNAAASGGSNLAASNPKLRERVTEQLTKQYTGQSNVPCDLVTASGSGLDPHISLAGALPQADRVATARGRPRSVIEELLRRSATTPPDGVPIVNVLLVNLALDDS
ncbi:MAG: potassium-transporting ATPase subunit KdpC [Gemmataceae bacterium]|nr:potassium-transporting ATPase subunit KdpC [Gemmataceae bacterium]